MQANTKKFGITTILVGAALALLPFQANAEYDQSLIFPTCALSVHPFKVGGTFVNEFASQWYNIFTGSGVCTQHLQYPNQYTPPNPTSQDTPPLKNVAGVENIYAPRTIHNHVYHNASKEEQDNTPVDNFWYKSYMAKFQIILEQDALAKTDQLQLVCGTPTGPNTYVETPGCNGTVNAWGTTNVSFDSNTGVVTWDFAEGPNKTGRPMLWGNNPSLGKQHGYFGAYVKLVSKNNPEQVWTATTTSRTLIRDLALKVNTTSDGTIDGDEPSCANDGVPGSIKDYDGNWCTTPAPNIDGVEQTNVLDDGKAYYWFRIGVVGTVWQKAAELQACTSLSITNADAQDGIIEAVSGQPFNYNFNVTSSTTGGLNLNYRWTAQPVSGTFDGQASGYIDTNTAAAYANNAPTDGIVVTVTAVKAGDPNTVYENCKDSVTIKVPPPVQPACIDFKILRNGVDVGDSIPLADPIDGLTVEATSAEPLDFRWTAKKDNNLQGIFSTLAYPNGNPLTVDKTVNIMSYSGGVGGTIITAEGINQNTQELRPGCFDQFVLIGQPPENVCVNLNLNPPNASVSYGQSVTLNANPVNQIAPHPADLIWSEVGPGFFTLGPTSMALNVLHTLDPIVNPVFCPAPLNDAPFTRPKPCDYVYNAAADGGGSFSVEASPNLGNVQVCKYSFKVPVKPPEVTPVCTGLNLDPDVINANSSTTYGGSATFSDGQTYPVNVDWSGVNGSFQNGQAFHQQNNVSSQSINNTFNSTANSGHVTAKVTSFAYNGQTINVGANECKWDVDLAAPPCEDLNLYDNNGEICIHVDGNYSGPFTWTIGGNTLPPGNDICKPFTFDFVSVVATNEPQCKDERPPVKIPPPSLVKGVRRTGGGNFVQILSIASNQKDLEYKLTFEPNSSYPISAVITDDISDGIIDGKTNPEVGDAGDLIYKSGSMTINLPQCSETQTSNCYQGDIGNGGVTLVKVTGTVTITYQATVNQSAITPANCLEGKICQEIYENLATANYSIHYSEENQTPYETVQSNATAPNMPGIPVRVQIFCQYILTRAAGDIFLETDLNAGVDIRKCSRYKSTTGVIITPGDTPEGELVSTGPALPGKIFTISHEICSEGQAGVLPEELKPFYGEDVSSNLSSQICEVKLRSGEAWKQTAITNSIDENKTRISRWEPDYTGNVNIGTIKLNLEYQDKQVFHVKGGNLTIDQLYTLNDGEGAKTFIIEDGDLMINQDISYGTCPADKAPCNVRDIASLAFIVLNGSVYVNPNVQNISGVYFVQEGNRANSGLLFSGSPENSKQSSDKKLTVYGSIYGDIEPLFIQRQFSGSPEEEDAGIVIRFDERVILNTPPGLRDVLNLTQTEVAR